MIWVILEPNAFCSHRTYVQKKSGFVCNNYRQRFPSKNFLQIVIPSYVERASIFFPIVQFNWFSDFEEFSRQLNIHYWNKKIRY